VCSIDPDGIKEKVTPMFGLEWNLVRQTSACLLVLVLAFVGMNVTPTALPQAHAQGYSVVGTILGLAIIAGVI
jgi:hypothetical protein